MKQFVSCGIVLVLVHVPLLAGEEKTPKQVAKEKAEEINQALLKGEYGKVADLTHPNLVKMSGGRDMMIVAIEFGVKLLKDKGIDYLSTKTENPGDPVTAGTEMYIVVPFRLELKAPGGKITGKSFVIGVSNDRGKSWTFVNGDVPAAQVKLILPNLPKGLKLPEREKAVFEKE
jgi:hypothetical protein